MLLQLLAREQAAVSILPLQLRTHVLDLPRATIEHRWLEELIVAFSHNEGLDIAVL